MNAFQIYLVIFGVGFLFTIISAVLADVFGGHGVHGGVDHPGHAEAGFGSNDMPGFSPLSPTSIATFMTAFGGFGMIFTQIEITSSPWLSAPLAVLGGVVVAGIVFLMFRTVFRRTQGSSESKVAGLVGMAATIITPIPTDGVGEIAYVQSGSRYTAPARSEKGVVVASGQTVKITRVVGTQFYVVPA